MESAKTISPSQRRNIEVLKRFIFEPVIPPALQVDSGSGDFAAVAALCNRLESWRFARKELAAALALMSICDFCKGRREHGYFQC
jgi:hypothetical protein